MEKKIRKRKSKEELETLTRVSLYKQNNFLKKNKK